MGFSSSLGRLAEETVGLPDLARGNTCGDHCSTFGHLLLGHSLKGHGPGMFPNMGYNSQVGKHCPGGNRY